MYSFENDHSQPSPFLQPFWWHSWYSASPFPCPLIIHSILTHSDDHSFFWWWPINVSQCIQYCQYSILSAENNENQFSNPSKTNQLSMKKYQWEEKYSVTNIQWETIQPANIQSINVNHSTIHHQREISACQYLASEKANHPREKPPIQSCPASQSEKLNVSYNNKPAEINYQYNIVPILYNENRYHSFHWWFHSYRYRNYFYSIR